MHQLEVMVFTVTVSLSDGARAAAIRMIQELELESWAAVCQLVCESHRATPNRTGRLDSEEAPVDSDSALGAVFGSGLSLTVTHWQPAPRT
mmetsp:Transcript_50586/g.101476  ORF Transcript_50586/g.101476 Transcript_50586/m.101476 type:complete len:91 (+) Transcript_50586:444-716(+)